MKQWMPDPLYYENAALSGSVAIYMFWGELHFPLMAAWVLVGDEGEANHYD